MAPPLQVSEWLNNPEPLRWEALQGRVVLVHAFQMLCPGCVSQGLPQALRVHHLFPRDDVLVLGLHTVFEHHAAMQPDALRVFLKEYRIPFPVGVDRADPSGPVPLTMRDYGLRGTPSLLVFDRQGRLRLNHFGALDDLQLGALMGQWVSESHAPATRPADAPSADAMGDAACTEGRCALPVHSGQPQGAS